MTAGSDVAAHYASGSLLDAIRNGLDRAGTGIEDATIDHLAPVDEFHIGGRQATQHLCGQLDLGCDDHVLDVGCGIGGTARFLASVYECAVTGIDLTPEYVDVARALSQWTGLADRTDFVLGSALDTGVAAETFDRAVQVHVGMNIPDKGSLFAEVHRVLRPGGELGVYDIMRTSSADPAFPVPWASDATMSHVESLDVYRAALVDAGFDIVAESDRGDFAREFFAQVQQRSTGGPPPIGLHLIMGADAPIKIGNMVAGVSAGSLAPTEIIARKPS
ncbi:methyltransferase domain-containing protein [Ilumatobacter sp.]|uniref:methyltransferase domain-containing protein n=1 Tax=Ilumatobacter sp. TaxID=1967498 RepID=UPI003AF4DF50